MLQLYLLWIVVVLGGFYMGVGSVVFQVQNGFDLALTLNAVLYLGVAFYGLPRFVSLLRGALKS